MTELAVAEQSAPVAPPPPPVAETPPAAPATGEQNLAEQAPAPTEPPPEKQAKTRFERRIDAANRRYGQEKARADFLAAEIEKLRPKPAADAGAPKLESFNDIEAYANAKAEYVKEQALRDFQARQQQETQAQRISRLSEEWQSKAAEAEEKYEDFHDVVGDIRPDNPLSAGVIAAGPDVAYYLGKHLVEARGIASMGDPVKQLVALGRLAAKLESDPPVAKQPSKAPEPISPVSGKSPAPSDLPSEEDDMRTWVRKRTKQVRGK